MGTVFFPISNYKQKIPRRKRALCLDHFSADIGLLWYYQIEKGLQGLLKQEN